MPILPFHYSTMTPIPELTLDLETILHTGRFRTVARLQGPPQDTQTCLANPGTGIIYAGLVANYIRDLLAHEFNAEPQGEIPSLPGNHVKREYRMRLPDEHPITITTDTTLSPGGNRIEAGTIRVSVPESPSSPGVHQRLMDFKRYVEGTSDQPFLSSLQRY